MHEIKKNTVKYVKNYLYLMLSLHYHYSMCSNEVSGQRQRALGGEYYSTLPANHYWCLQLLLIQLTVNDESRCGI